MTCSECGTVLGGRSASGEAGAGTLRFTTDQVRAALSKDSGTTNPNLNSARWQIGLKVHGQTIRLSGKDEYHIGRAESGQATKPDVDLSPFRALELGVSRMHATLTINGTSLTLTDLGSTNGSMVNSVKLQPNAPFQLNDGDEIRLGKLALRVYFEPGQTG
ncbi:MAG: FHA domain-containing protein [Chloroflexi bacterium]|nr:FHA domain-containing protein [Chloroflexota bacterium]